MFGGWKILAGAPRYLLFHLIETESACAQSRLKVIFCHIVLQCLTGCQDQVKHNSSCGSFAASLVKECHPRNPRPSLC